MVRVVNSRRGKALQIGTREVSNILVIDMMGRLDTLTSSGAYDEMVRIAENGGDKMVLNLDKLEFIGSAGLRVILKAAKLLRASSGEMKICHANGMVKEVLDTSGFDYLIDIYDNEEDAITAFGA